MRLLLIAFLIADSSRAQTSSTFEALPTLAGGDLADFRDSTPDPGATGIYFTAIGPTGPGVFRVPAAGGAASVVFTGAPFVDPTGIAISNDGQTLYVADPKAYAGPRRLGSIFALSVTGQRPLPVDGAQGWAAHGLDLSPGGDVLYFTGRSPETRNRGVYRLPATGAPAPETLLEDDAIGVPDSVTASRAGVLYFTSRREDSGHGGVYRLERRAVTRIVDLIRPGAPAGLALTMDESALLVSSLQPYRNRAQVLVVNLDSLEIRAETRVIGVNSHPGGLHRARNSDLFSWIDRTNNVYRVRP
jgi:sugar lactone lactonase YvrE